MVGGSLSPLCRYLFAFLNGWRWYQNLFKMQVNLFLKVLGTHLRNTQSETTGQHQFWQRIQNFWFFNFWCNKLYIFWLEIISTLRMHSFEIFNAHITKKKTIFAHLYWCLDRISIFPIFLVTIGKKPEKG